MPSPTAIEVRRFASRAELETALAERLQRAITESSSGARALGAGGSVIMLSGGSTPLPAYRALSARSLKPTRDLRLMFSDDRYVPSTADASNYHQCLPLIESLGLPDDSVLRVRTELPLEQAARDCEQRIDSLTRDGVRFTLGLLGLGADGHTASLFNSGDIDNSKGRRAIPVNRPDKMQAVSVTPEVLARFEELTFIIAGADKDNAVRLLLSGDPGIAATLAIAGRAKTLVWLAP